MEKNMVRLAGILYESLVNGPGIRRVIFAQGCRHNCKGCFNPHTHSFDSGNLMNMDDIVNDILQNPMLGGVTFSGGDPFEQSEKFAYMAKRIKENKLNIWCFTGYTFEQLQKNKENNPGWDELLKSIDVLVDGKFEEAKKDDHIKFRGSTNQRIIDVQESIKKGSVSILNYDN